jgi:hypothetical protein
MTEKALLANQQAEAAAKRPAPSIGRQTKPDSIPDVTGITRLPATVRKWSNLKCFKDDGDMRSDMKAYRFGQFLRGAVLGSEKAKQWCFQNGVEIRGAMPPEPGLALTCFREGVDSGVLTVSGERQGTHIIADIVTGTPRKGDLVFK